MADQATNVTNLCASGAITAGGVQIPFTKTLGAVSADTTFCVLVAPYAGTITAVKLVTKDAVAASDSTYWTFTLTNKGQAGAGTTTVATCTTKTTGGAAISAYTPYSITLSATAANLVVAAGDVLTFLCDITSTATALAEAMLQVYYKPTDA